MSGGMKGQDQDFSFTFKEVLLRMYFLRQPASSLCVNHHTCTRMLVTSLKLH